MPFKSWNNSLTLRVVKTGRCGPVRVYCGHEHLHNKLYKPATAPKRFLWTRVSQRTVCGVVYTRRTKLYTVLSWPVGLITMLFPGTFTVCLFGLFKNSYNLFIHLNLLINAFEQFLVLQIQIGSDSNCLLV